MAEHLVTKRAYQSLDDVDGHERHGAPDRSYLINTIFDEDRAGESLLDIGCNLGQFCREGARRGMEATGIDTDSEAIEGAISAASGMPSPPAYITGDFEEYDWSGRSFDTILALNVLHHMFDPVHVLRRMQVMARRRIILEVAQPTWRDRKLVLRSPGFILARWMPVIWLDQTRKPRRVGSRTFVFTRRALSVLFNEHTTIFEPLRFHRSPFKDRLLVEARKRDIGHLVVVAGPTSSGKSTFIERFTGDARFREEFVSDTGEWTTTTAYKVGSLPSGRIERLVLHYDMLRLMSGSLKTFERDPNLDILRIADKVTILTIGSSRERMIRQIEASALSGPKWLQRKRHRTIRDQYQSPEFLRRWYELWFEFCRSVPQARTILVENNGQFVPRPVEAYRDVLA